MKAMCFVARRPTVSRENFRHYYEHHHAPLASVYFPFEKYVRNHLVTSSPSDIGFDCIMECWIDQEAAMDVLKGDVERIFAEDERRFMKQRAIGIMVEERVLAGPPRGLETPGTYKESLMIRWGSGSEGRALIQRAAEWASVLVAGGQTSRVTMDVARLPTAMALGADVMLTAWKQNAAEMVFGREVPMDVVGRLVSVPSETAPENLSTIERRHAE